MEQDHGVGRVDHAIGEYTVEIEVDDHRCVTDMRADTGQYATFGIAFGIAGHSAVHADTRPVDTFSLADLGEQFVDEAIEIGLDDEATADSCPGCVGGYHFYTTVISENFDYWYRVGRR